MPGQDQISLLNVNICHVRDKNLTTAWPQADGSQPAGSAHNHPPGRLTPISRHFHPFQPISAHSHLCTAAGDPSRTPPT